MNIGIAGFGSMGKTHAYCIENLKYYYCDEGPSPVLYGVCASSAERAAEYADKYGIKHSFSSFDEMVACPDIDVIDICTPNNIHYSQILSAIKAGKHIYCEKPLCTTSEQANDVARLAKENNVTCAVVFNTRFHLPVIRAKELIEKGRLGDILSFSASFLHSSALNPEKSGWKQDRDICGGGVLFDLGSHALDMMYHLIGKYDSICAKSQIAFKERVSVRGESGWQTNADEAFYMLCKMENGACGNITVSKIHNGTNDDFAFEIYGTKGSLRFSLMESDWLYFYDATAEEDERGFTRIECCSRFAPPATQFPGAKATVGWIRSHVGSMHAFLTCVKNQSETSPSFDDAAYIQKVLDVAYRADAAGVWLSVEG